jgi:hypothetical protein
VHHWFKGRSTRGKECDDDTNNNIMNRGVLETSAGQFVRSELAENIL